MKTLALKLISFSKLNTAVELTQSEITALTTIAELYGKLETLQELHDSKICSLDNQIENVRYELITVLKRNGMLESEIIAFVCGPIPFLSPESINKTIAQYITNI